jgi:hypothetical protein
MKDNCDYIISVNVNSNGYSEWKWWEANYCRQYGDVPWRVAASLRLCVLLMTIHLLQ